MNFATTNNFKITNTFYKKKQNRRWTWRSPDFETFNEIDYVLVDKSNIVKNTEVLNRVGIDSDHRMVRCKIQIDTKLERQKLFHSKQEPLRVSKQFEKDFQIDLKNRFAVLEELEEENNNNEVNVNDLNNNIIKPMIAAGKKKLENHFQKNRQVLK